MTGYESFLLDPEYTHLNHAAFGACPHPVFEVYQDWQRALERRPVEFFERRLEGALDAVRAAIADYVGAQADDLVLVQNVMSGLNAVLRSIALDPGDEILTTRHEYGATDALLEFVAKRTGARIIRRGGTDANAIWAGVGARTRVMVISHITSATAIVLPIEELCQRAREAGVISLIDGAHGPGQTPLSLAQLGSDFYIGSCHKWLCGPKAAAFVYMRRECQALVEPLVAGRERGNSQSALHDDWRNARDPAAYLTVPAAIEYVRHYGRNARCRAILKESIRLLTSAGFEVIGSEQPLQMASFSLPACDLALVSRRLVEEFRIEVAIKDRRGDPLLRLSIAPYNTLEDTARLVEALLAVFADREL